MPRKIAESLRPKLFVASSSEALDLAYAAQQNLERYADVTVWDQGAIKPSSTTIEALIDTVHRSDFGVFVFSPDDVAIIRKVECDAVRDNVIWELGLFVGRLGRNRCFILAPRNFQSLRLPSDLLGIKTAEYDFSRSDRRAALGASCAEIGSIIQEQGRFMVEVQPHIASLDEVFAVNPRNGDIAGYWLSRFEYKAYRNKRYVRGAQYGLERLGPISAKTFWGFNIAWAADSTKHYEHDLRLRVAGSYALGTWVNTNSHNFGSFQLHIDNSKNTMKGQCLGNANDNSIQVGAWNWFRVAQANSELCQRFDDSESLMLKPFHELESQYKRWRDKETPVTIEEIIG